MWELYDTLTDRVSEELHITDFAVGPYWTAVTTDGGSAGIAPTYTETWQRFEMKTDFRRGMSVKEAAAGIKSWNYHEASLGLAAVNAFYNREDLLPEAALRYPKGRRSRGVFLKLCESHTAGTHTIMAEPPYDREELSDAPGIIDIVRLDTTYRDYRFDAYRELMPKADNAVLGGMALMRKIAEPFIEAASGKNVWLWGPGVPLADCLFNYSSDIKEITGFIVDDPEKCLDLVKVGGGRDEILKLGHFVTLMR